MTDFNREYAIRQALQATRSAYREAARRLHPDVTVADHAHVSTSVDQDGAFVECIVWVPKEDL